MKIYLSFLFLTIFCIGKSQFAGIYNMHDGGVDAPSSSLLILPEHEFLLIYLGGFKKGIWREIDNNSIELTESTLFEAPIFLYGKATKNKASTVTFDFSALSKAHALLRFSNDENFTEEMKPIFNNWPNCMEKEYVIKKNVGDNNYLNVSVPASPEFGHFGIHYPYKVLNYTFQIDKKYNHFTFIPGSDANKDAFKLIITRKGTTYIMNGYGEQRESERKDLDEKMLAEIAKLKLQIKQHLIREDLGKKISVVKQTKDVVYKLNPNPYFTAYCEGDEEETSGPDYFTKPRTLKPINRENGVYTISNFDENNIRPDEFVIAKESSLTQKDFLTAEKQISDYDGYEIKLTFTKEGTKKFTNLLKDNARNPVAFVIDHKIIEVYYHFFHNNKQEVLIGQRISEPEMDDLIIKMNAKK